MECVWNAETGTAEWNMSGLVECEERACKLTEDMMNASDLIISNSDTTLWQAGSNRTRPITVLAGNTVSFKCPNGNLIESRCSTSYLYTPKWETSCESIFLFARLSSEL